MALTKSGHNLGLVFTIYGFSALVNRFSALAPGHIRTYTLRDVLIVAPQFPSPRSPVFYSLRQCLRIACLFFLQFIYTCNMGIQRVSEFCASKLIVLRCRPIRMATARWTMTRSFFALRRLTMIHIKTFLTIHFHV